MRSGLAQALGRYDHHRRCRSCRKLEYCAATVVPRDRPEGDAVAQAISRSCEDLADDCEAVGHHYDAVGEQYRLVDISW
jgi:hypothetical protein